EESIRLLLVLLGRGEERHQKEQRIHVLSTPERGVRLAQNADISPQPTAGPQRLVVWKIMRTLAALLLLLGGLAFGDIVHLRNGGKIEGKVTDKGDQLEVETANGKVTVE